MSYEEFSQSSIAPQYNALPRAGYPAPTPATRNSRTSLRSPDDGSFATNSVVTPSVVEWSNSAPPVTVDLAGGAHEIQAGDVKRYYSSPTEISETVNVPRPSTRGSVRSANDDVELRSASKSELESVTDDYEDLEGARMPNRGRTPIESLHPSQPEWIENPEGQVENSNYSSAFTPTPSSRSLQKAFEDENLLPATQSEQQSSFQLQPESSIGKTAPIPSGRALGTFPDDDDVVGQTETYSPELEANFEFKGHAPIPRGRSLGRIPDDDVESTEASRSEMEPNLDVESDDWAKAEGHAPIPRGRSLRRIADDGVEWTEASRAEMEPTFEAEPDKVNAPIPSARSLRNIADKNIELAQGSSQQSPSLDDQTFGVNETIDPLLVLEGLERIPDDDVEPMEGGEFADASGSQKPRIVPAIFPRKRSVEDYVSSPSAVSVQTPSISSPVEEPFSVASAGMLHSAPDVEPMEVGKLAGRELQSTPVIPPRNMSTGDYNGASPSAEISSIPSPGEEPDFATTAGRLHSAPEEYEPLANTTPVPSARRHVVSESGDQEPSLDYGDSYAAEEFMRTRPTPSVRSSNAEPMKAEPSEVLWFDWLHRKPQIIFVCLSRRLKSLLRLDVNIVLLLPCLLF